MPDPTPDPWAAAVEAFLDAPPCMRTGEHEPLECSQCTAIGLRAALPHLLEAVVGEVDDDTADSLVGDICDVADNPTDSYGSINLDRARISLLATLQRAAARLTDG